MEILVGAIIVTVAIVVMAGQIVTELKRGGDERRLERQLSIATLFAAALGQVQDDPKALLTWQPLAKLLRKQFPAEFAALDVANGSTFPFSTDVITGAHAKWTAQWLAWERMHDATYKMKAVELQHGLQASADMTAARARLDAIEREKLDVYQRRYEDYIRVAKALQGLS